MDVYNKIIYNNDKQRFECTNCPDICCKSFSIKVDKTILKDISDLPTVKELLKSGNSSFEYHTNNQFYLPVKINNDGYKCLFHDDQKHCIIHNEYGYSYKPPECQLYPFSMYIDQDKNLHIEASFKCKSILENYGKKINDIKDSFACNYINIEYYPTTYSLYDNNLSQKQVFSIADKLRSILNSSAYSTDENVFRYFDFLSNFKEAIKNGQSFEEAISLPLTNDVKSVNIQKSRISKHIECMLIANMLLYKNFHRNCLNFKDGKKVINKYIYFYSSVNKRSDKMKLYYGKEYINLQEASKVSIQSDKDSEELINRFLLSSVIRHKYLTLENNDLKFFNRVIIYYSLIKSYSKIVATLNKRSNTQFSDISNAVSTIEFIFYHTNITLIPAKTLSNTVNKFLHKSLEQPNVVQNLIYEPLS